MVRDFGLLAQSDGIKVIMSSLSEGGSGSGDLAPYLAATIMAMVDRPMYRQYLRPGVDFEVRTLCVHCSKGRVNYTIDILWGGGLDRSGWYYRSGSSFFSCTRRKGEIKCPLDCLSDEILDWSVPVLFFSSSPMDSELSKPCLKLTFCI